MNWIIDPETGCWSWIRHVSAQTGYGQWTKMIDGKRKLAHRVVFESFRGDIPAGLDLDHLCRNRACVNPWHLEPVTRQTNVRRGEGFAARNAAKTSCVRGHPFVGDGADVYVWRGSRICRACKRAREMAVAS